MKIKSILMVALSWCLPIVLTGCFSPDTDIKKSNLKTDRIHVDPATVGYRQVPMTNMIGSANGTLTNIEWKTVPIEANEPDGRLTTEECSASQKSFMRKWFPWLCSNKAFDCPNEQQKCPTAPASSPPGLTGGSWVPAPAFPGYVPGGCCGPGPMPPGLMGGPPDIRYDERVPGGTVHHDWQQQ